MYIAWLLMLFIIRPEVVEECAWETHKLLGSPANLLLTKYSLAGMTVADLQKYLDQLGLEKALMLIKKPGTIMLLYVDTVYYWMFMKYRSVGSLL